MLGEYQGRLSAAQIAPYVNAGFPALFDPEEPGFPNAKRQRRCFTESEWTFFRSFVAKNDFAGVNVYPDLLPPGCAEAIYARLGDPVATTVLPGAGSVAFVPKPEAMRAELDPEGGLRLVYVKAGDPKDSLNEEIVK